MSDSRTNDQAHENLPRARTKRRGWRFPFVWIVPVVAACVSGYLVFERSREFGPRITIRFKDASGLRVGQTQIQYRGVNVGEVRAVELSQDQEFAVVTARLKRAAASIAREKSLFWIVRPTVGIANITGLGTLIAGPHLEVLPGPGAACSDYVGLENAPAALEPNGLNLVLLASHLGALKPGSPVYYRGFDVGAVRDTQLSSNATSVEIQVFIKQQYADLVRSGSKFWNVSGMEVKVGLFRGAEINMESFRSLLVGGVAFATPNDPKETPVKDGARFPLFEEPKKEWQEWNPERAIAREK